MKDWKGDTNSIFKIIGASTHSNYEREQHDYYATEPKATELLLEQETFDHNIWEIACGGHISEVLEQHGYNVYNTDLIQRYEKQHEQLDFLTSDRHFDGDIITNPPYKYATEFVEKAIKSINIGNKVAMFLKLTFLESQQRREFFKKYPPKVIYVASKRLYCGMNGEFKSGSAVCYAWFIWEKGFTGDPIIKWIN